MNKGIFTYSLLKYRHSQVLGEVLNIGLLVYFPLNNQLRFIYPEKLIRLRFAYPNVPVKTIKSYFRYFEQHTSELNEVPDLFHTYNLKDSFENFIRNEFLPSDSSVLQFDQPKNSVLYTTDIDYICNQLYNLYFSVFEHQDNSLVKINEKVLLKQYKKLIELHSVGDDPFYPLDLPKLKYDFVIEPSRDSKLKFEIAWQSKTDLHLVKPVSFDLVKPESIMKKAYQYWGQFTDLQDYASNHNYVFDVILAKPASKQLFKSYDNAVRVLDKVDRVKLIDYNNLDSYSKQTAELALN